MSERSARAPLQERAAAAAQVFVDRPDAPVLDPADAHHLLRVLRLRPGELVVASDGAGAWAMCRLTRSAAGRSSGCDGDPASLLEPTGPLRHEPAPSPALTVAFAPVKGDRPEWVVQKLTEVGVDRIVPLRAERSVVRWEGPRGQKNVERLRRVAREAAAQSRRTHLPEVTDVWSLEKLCESDPAGPELWLADLEGAPLSTEVTVVAVGPEGGWSMAELARVPRRAGLGPTILRSETAALVAGALLVGLRSGAVGLPATRPEAVQSRVGVPEST